MKWKVRWIGARGWLSLSGLVPLNGESREVGKVGVAGVWGDGLVFVGGKVRMVMIEMEDGYGMEVGYAGVRVVRERVDDGSVLSFYSYFWFFVVLMVGS